MSLNGQADQGTPQGRAGFSSDIAQSPLPQVSLPKGGGAVQGIGEKFSTNAMTGTASLSVPVVTSAARSGFGPSLLVGYDSGGGNGIFGVGWSLSLPSITRKTEKGLPRYLDAEESDVFILSGSEDLVPVLRRRSGGEWERDEVERNGFRVQFYRPRIEGLFSRIERWTSLRDGEIHWRTFSKDNVLSIYGDSPNSHIRDPEAPLHVFEWLISFSFDGLGNAIRYEYAEEDVRGVDLAKPGERQRGPACNRYPKRIRYGNRTPLRYGGRADTDAEWMFEVVFDFGDEGWNVFRASDGEDYVELTNASPSRPWQERKDPFSSWRSGFEIRTYRLCRRVLMFHHFPDELGVPRCLVRSTEFEYDEKAIGAFMVRVLQCGYTRSGEGAYLRKSLPPLELGYTRSPLEDECIRPLELKEAEAATLPEGIDGSRYRWVDLDGESIAGVLTEQGRGWYFSRNLGGGRFAYSRLIANKPAFSRLASAHQMLMDVAGSGSLDLVDFAPGRTGFYERSRERWEAGGLKAGWGRFRPFRKQPVLDWGGPDLRFVDLTGDGIPDVLITEDVAFRWHPSLREEGYGSAVRIPTPIDENDGPRIVFADPSQSIYLADMSGDGLADIVRIRNGEVCYWPNRGYGRFGGKIVMGGSPWFDELGLFDNQRIQLADTDGSGTTDILYLTGGEVHVYLNECGNSLSPRKVLRGLPSLGQDAVMVVDFLGRGTACLVFSSTLRSNQLRPLRYVDLMRGTKPHLLHKIVNNLGAETSIFYESSTTFYLADRAEGRPWLTALAFPVHVVSRTETVDFVSRSRLVSSLSYHHGFYDPLEREFRGFGRIDRLDAETFADDEQAPGSRQPSENEDKAWRLPPVETRTWLHTGVFLGADRISRHLAHEYYRAPDDTDKPRLDDTILPVGLAPEEAREACRALKGTQLRQEIYARDGSERADIPYSIAEANAAVRLLQARGPNRHSVFFAHERETISAALERTLYEVDGARRIDPRMTHVLVLEVDAFGNLLLSAQIAYGRRFPDPSPRLTDADRATQSRSLAVTARYRCTNPIDDAEAWRTPLPAECSVHELLHVPAAPWDGGRTGLLGFDEVRRLISQAADGSHDLPFQDYSASGATGPEPYQRMIGCKRTRYRADNLERLLPVGEAEALALPGQSYSLVLTPELTKQVYEDRIEPGRLFGSELGYADLDGDQRAWAPSGASSIPMVPVRTPRRSSLQRVGSSSCRRGFGTPSVTRRMCVTIDTASSRRKRATRSATRFTLGSITGCCDPTESPIPTATEPT